MLLPKKKHNLSAKPSVGVVQFFALFPPAHTILSCSPQTTCCPSNPLLGPVRNPSLPAINSRHSAASAARIVLALSICAGVHPNMMHVPMRLWRSPYQRFGGGSFANVGLLPSPLLAQRASCDEYERLAATSFGIKALPAPAEEVAAAEGRRSLRAVRGRSFARDGIVGGCRGLTLGAKTIRDLLERKKKNNTKKKKCRAMQTENRYRPKVVLRVTRAKRDIPSTL